MINTDRLAQTFIALVEIDSVSKKEGKISEALKQIFEALGGDVLSDSAGEKIGSEADNLIIKINGDTSAPALLLNAHMDTVQPGEGIKVRLDNGVFRSEGNTILGADDKSAIAIIIETIRILQEKNIPHGPIEIVLTVCEEIGLQGAKNLDYSLVTAKYGYALDATDTEGIVVQAPAANRFELEVIGKDAHAGAAPEKGINAIFIAAKAIAALRLGRIDRETTCNIGIIEGGLARNIIPKRVTIQGEVRSHNPEKLKKLTEEIIATFKTVITEHRDSSGSARLPDLKIIVEDDFPGTRLPEDHPVVTLARKAARNLGRTVAPKITGGGADANIFFGEGIITGVLGTGMRNMHTVREQVELEDMKKTVELLIEIIRLHSGEK